MDAATAYFLKKYYPHVIKWWLVVYNPEVIRIWPSEKEKEEALRIEAEEAERLALLAPEEEIDDAALPNDMAAIDASAYNAATGSYSGLYGQKPVDAQTQAALDSIMNASNNQNSVDYLLSGGEPAQGAAYAVNNDNIGTNDVVLPPEQDEIIKEANAIYERLMREAAEDEAKKIAELRDAYDKAQSGQIE